MTEFIPPSTQFVALAQRFAFKRGGYIEGARLAYETWGRLNAAGDNAVLILTGLSPSAHAASSAADPSPGWWEANIGPGKPIDTDRYFVICPNTLGSCRGSTGPASLNPQTGTPWRLDYPELSIEDGARAARSLLDTLGIERLAAVVGCSMGGMSALAFLQQNPGFARGHLNVSGATRALPFSIAIRSLQREAIRLDPNWNEGHYDDASLSQGRYPETGMRIARKLGVVTYRSAMEWHGRFGRVRLEPDERDDLPFGHEFQVESYLDAHADRFARAFDPNCYLYLSRSMDWFDLGEYAGGDVAKALASLEVERSLTIGVETDILFPLSQQEEIASGLAAGGCDSQFAGLPSPQGHDAFLVDHDRFSPLIAEFFVQR